MAIRFDYTANKVTVSQTRRGFFAAVVALFALAVMGGVLFVAISRLSTHTILACDRATHGCTLTRDRLRQRLDLSTLTSVELRSFQARPGNPRSVVASIVLHRNQPPQYLEICGSVSAPAAAARARENTDALQRFLATASAQPLSFACDGRDVSLATRDPFLPLGFFLLGCVAVVLLFARFATEIRSEFDHVAGTVSVRTRVWRVPMSFQKPLGDLLRIETRARVQARGGRALVAVAFFRGGATATILSPIWMTPAVLAGHVAELSRALGLAS